MSFRILDGMGKGTTANITRTNKISVLAETLPMQAYYSMTRSHAYQAHSGERTLTTAGTHGLLALRNDTEDKTYVITYIRCGVNETETVGCRVDVKLNGTWANGTQTSIFNCNTSSSLTSGGLAHTNTSLSNASTIDMHYMKGPDEVAWAKEGSLVIPPGGIISVDIITKTNSVKAYGCISFIVLSKNDILDRQ